jgi:glycosyltransferase involved in cell wall biosynthesis
MSEERVIVLLGRSDEPTDAVEEYCRLLGRALQEHSFSVELRRVPWNEHGWTASLNALRLQAESWCDTWVLLQYTNLAWSARGFPSRFLRVLRVLRKAGARLAVVFHDAEPFGGIRLIDRFRRAVQLRVMRDAVAFADCAVLTVAPARLSWLQNLPPTASFIPVGANLPQPLLEQDHDKIHDPPTIAVYGITGGAPGDCETDEIIRVVRHTAARVGKLRLLVFGRHAEVRENALRTGLQGCGVEVRVEGVIDADSLVERFAASDVLLFLRGTISSRRGSAIAGIACGLPVIGLRGQETDAPIMDAGVVLLENNANSEALRQQFGETLARILSDGTYRRDLAARSRSAQENSFSWPAIARRYAEALRKQRPRNAVTNATDRSVAPPST